MASDQTNLSPWAASLSENHFVETPEQITVQFAIAGIGSRALALLVDSAIQFALLLCGSFAILLVPRLGVLHRSSFGSAWALAGLIVFLFLLFYGYFVLFEMLWGGQTPGKRAVGIRVMKETGRPLTLAETAGRNLLRIVDSLPGMYAIGILVALLNRQNKRLGDFVAGSIVVRERTASNVKNSWSYAAMEVPGTTRTPVGADRLTAADLVLVESFLQRRHELSPGIRGSMARKVFREIEPRLRMDPQRKQQESLESLLEAAVRERRGS